MDKYPHTPLTRVNTCSCNENRHVEYFCKEHDGLFCRSCKYLHHVNCKFHALKNVAHGILARANLNQTMSELSRMRKVFMKMRENKSLASIQHRQEKNAAENLSKNLIHIMLKPEVENSLHVAVEGMHVGGYAEKMFISKRSVEIVDDIDFFLSSLKCFIEDENEVGTFIVYHRARKELSELRSLLNTLGEGHSGHLFPQLQSTAHEHHLQSDPGSVKVSRTVHVRLPQINNQHSDPAQNIVHNARTPADPSRASSARQKSRGARLNSGRWRFRPVFKPQTTRMASILSSLKRSRSRRGITRASSFVKKLVSSLPEKELHLNHNPDSPELNHVTSMTNLKDGRFVVLDCRFNRIQLFGMDNRYHCEMPLHSSVWDCCYANKSILVTCPAEGKIQRVQVTSNNRLFEAGTILTQKDCRAICFYRSRIYVTYSGLSPGVKILSKDGIMYKSISATQGKTKIIQNPLYMHVARNRKLIYISDFTLQRLTVIDHKGNVKHTVDVSPNWPLAMTTDRDENIIFAVTGENNIRLLKKERHRMTTLIDAQRVKGEPSCVLCKPAFDGQRLYVAYGGSQIIKVFKLLY